MTPLQFCTGWSGKIMGEMPPQLAGTTTETQLRHLNRLLTLSMELDFDVVKSYGAALLRSIERGDNSWSNWPVMQDWQNRNMDTLRFKSSMKGKPVKDTEKDKGQAKTVEGVLEAFVRSSKLCITYQKGTCDELAAHTFGTSNTVLAHSCAMCLKRDKSGSADHYAKNCPRKKQLFRKGGGT